MSCSVFPFPILRILGISICFSPFKYFVVSVFAFNISLGALVYKIVNPQFADMLESSKEGDAFHNVISASWEIGFNDFYIAVGSNDLKEAEIVTNVPEVAQVAKPSNDWWSENPNYRK